MIGFNTTEPADTVEFCPHPEASDIFVCGTYKLNEKTELDMGVSDLAPVPLRQGRCLVFCVDRDQETDTPSFQQIQSIDFAAILDMKWHHTVPSANPILGVADSEGNINTLQWHLHERTLKRLDSVACAGGGTLCLSLDWSNRRTSQTNPGSLVTSLSNGYLCILRRESCGGLLKTDEWLAHDHEPWIAAWDYWETNTIYSGGDDLALKFWDVRQDLTRPFFVNRRFKAGVTAIQSHPYIEHLVAVGSYDSTIYLFDRRKASVALSDVPVGGGVWRVKWNPHENRREDLLAACMHDGFKVIRFESGMNSGQVVQRFDAHESLAYGVDWSFELPAKDGKQTVGSCSFYDHLLHIWKA